MPKAVKTRLLAARLLVLVAVTGTAAPAARADSSLRPFLDLRLGRAFFPRGEAVAGAELRGLAPQPFAGATLGADVGRYAALGVALDYVKNDLFRANGVDAGDYSVTALTGEVRLRYPVWGERLVPYLLMGGGLGLGEFSGRQDFTFQGGGSDAAPLGVAGAGLEYRLAPNLAAGLQGRYLFAFRPRLRVEGQHPALRAEHLGLTANLHLYFDHLAYGAPRPAAPARDRDTVRAYIALRGGRALFTDTDTAAGLRIEDTSGLLGNAALGLNLSRHLGIEGAAEYTRAQLSAPGVGDVSGYPVWTATLLGRLRLPMAADRLVPYLLVGGGLGWGERGDPDQDPARVAFFGSQERSAVAVFGAGAEFFLEPNIALGIEAKYTTFLSTSVTFGAARTTLRPEFVSLSAGLRIFYP